MSYQQTGESTRRIPPIPDKYHRCECGCEQFFVPVTEKNPKTLTCYRCKTQVDTSGLKLVVTR